MKNDNDRIDSISSPFFNRELSWLDFNERVLEEGLRKDLPALDRFKFLSIAAANLDEFFMVRVAAIKRSQKSGGAKEVSGVLPNELLRQISHKVRSVKERLSAAFVDEVFPNLAQGGLSLLRPNQWSQQQYEYLQSLFAREVYPLLTPLRMPEEDRLPTIDNYSIHAAFLLEADNSQAWAKNSSLPQEHISIMRIPSALDRVIWLPETELPVETLFPMEIIPDSTRQCRFVLLEDLVQTFSNLLYPGFTIKESLVFKINRDADISVDEKRDEDFIEAMEEVLEGRDHSKPIRLVYMPGSLKILNALASRLTLEETDLYEVLYPINPLKLHELFLSRGFDHLREKAWKIYPHHVLHKDEPIWDSIKAGDVLLHLPYQSFDPVVRFFQEAAEDPQVAAIKTTLYRTSGESLVVRALEQASLAGKHVTAVVELKARFDEGQNISWAHRLEKAGVIVVYGVAHLKIHAKATIVMRREHGRIKRYAHLSTGNYNEKTARLYEDLALFSAREDIVYDTGILFNMITGYSAIQATGRLVIAPTALKRRILDLISRETNRSSPEAPGKIMAKMNALADPEIIWALYRASQMGVTVLLNVRGICMLTPGVKGLSDNIRVVSIIDRYLEHSRMYYFANGGDEEIYLASADWMTRNLERRVELMFPLLQEDTKKAALETLQAYFKDNCQAWLLDAQGAWTRLTPAPGVKPFRAQAFFHARAGEAVAGNSKGATQGEFVVRRSTPVEV